MLNGDEILKIAADRTSLFSKHYKKFWRLSCDDADIVQQACLAIVKNKDKYHPKAFHRIIKNEIWNYINRTLKTKAFPRNPTRTYKGREYKWFVPLEPVHEYSKEHVCWPDKERDETYFYEKKLELLKKHYNPDASYDVKRRQKRKIKEEYERWLRDA